MTMFKNITFKSIESIFLPKFLNYFIWDNVIFLNKNSKKEIAGNSLEIFIKHEFHKEMNSLKYYLNYFFSPFFRAKVLYKLFVGLLLEKIGDAKGNPFDNWETLTMLNLFAKKMCRSSFYLYSKEEAFFDIKLKVLLELKLNKRGKNGNNKQSRKSI